jgi:hypothetical protein
MLPILRFLSATRLHRVVEVSGGEETYLLQRVIRDLIVGYR